MNVTFTVQKYKLILRNKEGMNDKNKYIGNSCIM